MEGIACVSDYLTKIPHLADRVAADLVTADLVTAGEGATAPLSFFSHCTRRSFRGGPKHD
jgi:hypothetical protein